MELPDRFIPDVSNIDGETGIGESLILPIDAALGMYSATWRWEPCCTLKLHATAGYRFTKVFQMSLGYRILSTDYMAGEEPGEFLFDVNEYGPEIRFGFNFWLDYVLKLCN
jgi:hypothetical protein